jgi:hypothetical protein
LAITSSSGPSTPPLATEACALLPEFVAARTKVREVRASGSRERALTNHWNQ